MTLSDMMLTDEQRHKVCVCDTCTSRCADNLCGFVEHLQMVERAAIANAVMVLADKGLFAPWKWINAPLDDKSEGKQLTEAFALLAEARKVMGK